ncbi:hypothetical protein Pfo_017387 [Paulownia fortunei]|nr:hypothetical protein Pfo_017387 [Paulownia fortunei]
MQRSGGALLQRRALERAICGWNHLYKVFLSLMLVIWCLVFLLNIWIGHGDGQKEFGKEKSKIDRLSCTVPPGLDEFKNKAFSYRSIYLNVQAGSIIRRVEPGGAESSYKKEAKGACNIFSRDKDKYLRNPCSAVEKFVVIELSEGIFVDNIEMLLGRPVYPTDSWVKLGKLNAANQNDSTVHEFSGIDAVEKMLEDLISAHDKLPRGGLGIDVPDPVEEIRHQHGMPGDSVLKILMKKFRSLDMNYRYGDICKEYVKEIGDKGVLVDKIMSDFGYFTDSKEVMSKEIADLLS